MPNAEKPNAPETVAELKIVRSEQFTKMYSNSAQLEVSPWDFTFVFGEVKRSPDNPPQVEQQVAIVMSPQHAKALLGILASNLQEYEKHAGGEIRLIQSPSPDPEKPKPPTPVGVKTQ